MTIGKQKKSEMLEVRVSYETKQALREKARQEKRSVSDLVRDLITGDLGKGPKAPAQASAPPRRFRRLTAAAASVLTAAGLFVLLQQASYAQNVALQLDGTFVQEESGIHSFGTEVQLQYGETYELPLDPDEGYVFSFTAHEASSDAGDVMLALEVRRIREGEDVMIGGPEVYVSFNSSARVEFTGTDGGFYGVTIRARPSKDS